MHVTVKAPCSCIISKDRLGGQQKAHAAACFSILTPARAMSSRDPGKEADDLILLFIKKKIISKCLIGTETQIKTI